MGSGQDALSILIAKDEIRDLAMLYSRGVDRKDPALLRSLYTKDGVDLHGQFFQGTAEAYCDFLERSMPHMPYAGHHICNHLVSVDGDEGEGEVYALAYHIIPDGKGGLLEDLQAVRYVDRYRKEDGRWKFAKRVVEFDMRRTRPAEKVEIANREPGQDASYDTLTSRLFARGTRA
ncbi:nuclear transport factor 2 family protein [Phenylobacterium sp. LjRoot225]|uniref:nuclear transport factor 2 family protein n=1 Tax=Phenylobacterium sp. LjRoot225 TaxID=3342285 RepID=UPI003ED159F6